MSDTEFYTFFIPTVFDTESDTFSIPNFTIPNPILFLMPNLFDTKSEMIQKMEKFRNREVSKPKRHTLICMFSELLVFKPCHKIAWLIWLKWISCQTYLTSYICCIHCTKETIWTFQVCKTKYQILLDIDGWHQTKSFWNYESLENMKCTWTEESAKTEWPLHMWGQKYKSLLQN